MVCFATSTLPRRLTPSRDHACQQPQWSLHLGVIGDGLRESYYSWEWGDALFVVLDPFWNTTSRPHGVGAGSDPGSGSGDRWDWTFGQTQYDWLESTLSASNAPYKFIVTHHLVGGVSTYGRGGASAVAAGFEWGANASTFATNRPGWGSGSIHDILVANDVSAVFHGHDHCYADEVVDGIVYQEVAMPNDAGTTGTFCQSYSNVVDNSGHTRVTVTPSLTTVEYVRSLPGSGDNGRIDDTYTIAPSVTGPTPPVADAGPDQVVSDPDDSGSELVTMDGSGSTPGAGTITDYDWYEGVTLLGSGVNAVLDLAVGVHPLTLEVTDDNAITDIDIVDITVTSPESTEPDTTIVTPADASTVFSSPVTVSGTATDDVAVASTSLQLNDGAGNYWDGAVWSTDPTTVIATSLTEPNWTVDIGGLPDGSFNLSAFSEDTSANVETTPDMSTFTLDTSAPDPGTFRLETLSTTAGITFTTVPSLSRLLRQSWPVLFIVSTTQIR